MKEAPKREEHYGKMVWVNPTTESFRREECLCLNCGKMGSCPVAHTLYGMCVREDVAFTMTRCPKFEQKK